MAEWLLIEWPEGESAPTKYWLAQGGLGLPGLRRLMKMAHARWRIEMDYRELSDLGVEACPLSKPTRPVFREA